jgi:outer membrane lipoprotein SlyB
MRTIYTISSTLILVALVAGCASPMGPNQANGTVLGGATGVVLGSIIGHSRGHAAGGALLGGTIGALAGALVGKDIDDATRQRVSARQPLTIEDVKALTRANVGDDLIISQIKSTRTAYRLSSDQIIDLKNSGVSSKVIDCMINTATVSAQVREPVVGTYYYVVPPPYPYYFYSYPRYYVGPHGHWHHR